MDGRQSAIFVFQFVKSILQSHTWYIHGFRDSVLVCKMYDCYISIPSHQAMQAIPMVRLHEWKQTTC